MGTRCLTVFKKNEIEIVVLYRQYDGYPQCHGSDLKEFLTGKRVVNGYTDKDKTNGNFNGMECLAASVTAHFKEGVGEFYLYASGTRDRGEEFVYTLSEKSGVIHLKVQSGCVTFFGIPGTKQEEMEAIYDGPIEEFDPAKETIES